MKNTTNEKFSDNYSVAKRKIEYHLYKIIYSNVQNYVKSFTSITQVKKERKINYGAGILFT